MERLSMAQEDAALGTHISKSDSPPPEKPEEGGGGGQSAGCRLLRDDMSHPGNELSWVHGLSAGRAYR